MKIKCELDVLSFHYPYHNELKKEVCEYLKNYPNVQNNETNVKATMTEWNITTPQIEKLKSFAISNLLFLNWNLKDFEFYFIDFWANVYEKNDYTIPHTHEPTYFSLVYFLDTKKYHSPLIFTDSKKKIIPEEGKFLMFPSIIKHEVPKHNFNEKRITLAGNIQWKP